MGNFEQALHNTGDGFSTQGTPHKFLSHTTDESYREGTETLPYKIERSGTGAGVPPTTLHSSLFTIHCVKGTFTLTVPLLDRTKQTAI